MQVTLKDKVALITGASRGIGQGILLQLAKQQAYVVGTATSEKGAAGIMEALRAQGLEGTAKVLNVKQSESIAAVISEITKEVGAPAILVNNAGVTRDNLMLRMKSEEWDELLDTNLSAVFRVSKACLRPMLKARWGRIINIGSVVGATGNAGQANYAAAKAGIVGFSKSLAAELAERNITVNTVAPGFIDTDMTRALTEQQRDGIMQAIPMKRLGSVENIAHAVNFLASDAAEYVTGQTIHVNGGMYMN